MPRKRPAAQRRGLSQSSDSSRPSGPPVGPEESRLLGGPANVQVLGTLPGWRVPVAALRGVLRAYLRALGFPGAGVTLQLLDGRACRGLNRRFRGKDRSTDVLSFPNLTGRPPRGFAGYLGDLALCLPYAWRKRGRFDPDFGGEASFLLLHGLLHLSGQHHDTPPQERRMWRRSRLLHPAYLPFKSALKTLRPLS